MPADLTRTPEAFPLRLSPSLDAALIVRLSEAAYRDASFLDERIESGGAWVPWPEVEAFAAGLTGESDFIFHIGHVGSTLVSRLLGISPRIFALREPAALRTLALASLAGTPDHRRLESLMRLYARVWRDGQRSLVKATSFVGALSGEMLARHPSARAILMFTPPEPYLATILAGPASRVELQTNAGMRLGRLNARVGGEAWSVGGLSVGEAAAAAWTAEVCSLADTAARFPDRVLWFDFEDFLARPEAGLSAALDHLHGEARPVDLAAMMASPNFGRYAKATEHAYDAALRRDVLNAARAEHRDEITRGLRWLNAAGQGHPSIASAVRAVATAPRIG